MGRAPEPRVSPAALLSRPRRPPNRYRTASSTLPSLRDLVPLELREPRVETRGYYLSSLTGLNSHAVLNPFSLVLGRTESGRALVLRADLPATHIRHQRCRAGYADDFGDTGCIRGVDYSKVARTEPSTASTASTASTKKQECRPDACATGEMHSGQSSATRKSLWLCVLV